MQPTNKKGVNNMTVGVVLSLFVVILILAIIGVMQTFSADITQDVRDDYYTNSAGCNSTHKNLCSPAYKIANESIDSQLTIAEKQSNLGNVIMGAAVIMVLIGAFSFLIGRKMGAF